jgi:hypothetical protein
VKQEEETQQMINYPRFYEGNFKIKEEDEDEEKKETNLVSFFFFSSDLFNNRRIIKHQICVFMSLASILI